MLKIGQYTIIEEDQVSLPFTGFIGNYVHIRPRVIIGERSEVRDHCFIAPDVVIGRDTTIYQYCNIGMGTRIGDRCFIAVGTITQNDREITPRGQPWTCEPPIIEDDVRVGARCVIGAGVRLAKGCRIGAGAVVTRSTEPYCTYVGVPARKVGKIED